MILWRSRQDFEPVTFGLGNRCRRPSRFGAVPRRPEFVEFLRAAVPAHPGTATQCRTIGWQFGWQLPHFRSRSGCRGYKQRLYALFRMTSQLETSIQKVETFIARWQGQEGGQERANYALFLTELARLSTCRIPMLRRLRRTNATTMFSSAPSTPSRRRRLRRPHRPLQAQLLRPRSQAEPLEGREERDRRARTTCSPPTMSSRPRPARRAPRLGRADAQRQAAGGGICPRAAGRRMAGRRSFWSAMSATASRSMPTSPARGRTTRSSPTGRTSASISKTCASTMCATG